MVRGWLGEDEVLRKHFEALVRIKVTICCSSGVSANTERGPKQEGECWVGLSLRGW